MGLLDLAREDQYMRMRFGQGLFGGGSTANANPYFPGSSRVRAGAYQNTQYGTGAGSSNEPRANPIVQSQSKNLAGPQDDVQQYLRYKYFTQPMQEAELNRAQGIQNLGEYSAAPREAFERGQALSALYGLKPEQGGISGRYSTQGGTGEGSGRSFQGALPKVGAKPLSAQDVSTMGPEGQDILAKGYAPMEKAQTAQNIAQTNWQNRMTEAQFKASAAYNRMDAKAQADSLRAFGLQKARFLSQGFDMARHQAIVTALQDDQGNMSQAKYEQEYENIPYADRMILEGQYGLKAPQQAPQTAPSGTTKAALTGNKADILKKYGKQ